MTALGDDPVEVVFAHAGALPDVVRSVFARHGKPLAAGIAPAPDARAAELDSTPPATLKHLRYRAPVDVIANDYFVLETDGAEPMAVAAPMLAAALAFVAARGDR